MKNNNIKTFVAIGIGAALFFVLGRFVAIPSPVPNTNISLQYAVLGLLAAMYGPVAGGLIGFIGHALIDLSWGGIPWWSWVIASAFTGVVVGLFAKKLNLQGEVFFSGGLARFPVFRDSLQDFLEMPVRTHPMSQLAGAIGASVIGYQKLKSTRI